MVYMMEGVQGLYLSREACAALRIVDKDFPKVGSCGITGVCGQITEEVQEPGEENISSCKTMQGLGVTLESPKAKCGILIRVLPPPIPEELPFEIRPENAMKIEKWLLEFYASSVFNVCERQPLPLMSGSLPLVPPTTIHKASTVP